MHRRGLPLRTRREINSMDDGLMMDRRQWDFERMVQISGNYADGSTGATSESIQVYTVRPHFDCVFTVNRTSKWVCTQEKHSFYTASRVLRRKQGRVIDGHVGRNGTTISGIITMSEWVDVRYAEYPGIPLLPLCPEAKQIATRIAAHGRVNESD